MEAVIMTTTAIVVMQYNKPLVVCDIVTGFRAASEPGLLYTYGSECHASVEVWSEGN
jgi:hypothetical protein